MTASRSADFSDGQSTNGFTIVGEACNGADAVDATEQLNPDVVILDINMPVMDGEEAARLIKRARPAVRIIVYSSSLSGRIEDLLNDGIILGYVDKSATDDLVRRLLWIGSRLAAGFDPQGHFT